ncbi:hypothetical protein M514_03545 [Trichuris suis]|uniref:Decaprenyl-diphosphate synthase subunit 2 n=1 Tax=Trichuris suis TaxID=68888 RepID=A0A085NP98_9BILA
MHFATTLRNHFWRNVVRDAQKLVGCNEPYSSLQSLLNSDVASVALRVRKLLGTRHPLPETVKYFLRNGHDLLQTFSAVILLLSDASMAAKLPVAQDTSSSARILQSQRNIAEICEIIYAANFIHMSMMDCKDYNANSEKELLSLGNRMTVLGGDYLLATACVALANIGKPSVIASISKAISDMSTAAILRERFLRFAGVDSNSQLVRDTNLWHEQATLSIANLLAQCSMACADLVSASTDIQQSCFRYSKYTALLIALRLSVQRKHSGFSNVIRCIPSLTVDSSEIEKLFSEYSREALEALECFPLCDSVNSLRNFISSLNTMTNAEIIAA